MELKTKYQYTYFIHPYTIDEKKYDKYILKLLKNKKCKLRIFQKEKDLEIYNYFLPNVREYLFPTFELRDDLLKNFLDMSKEQKSRMLSKQSVSCFSYDIDKSIQGKVGCEDGIFFNIEKIEIICFSTGICFFVMKTNLENTNEFVDLLNFNYRFRDVNSEFYSLKNFENIKIQTNLFNEATDISELIHQITGIYKKKNLNENENPLSNSQFYTYSYVCLENKNWNEKNEFEFIESDFYKYANVLPANYSLDFNKENIEQNLHIIDNFKYYKMALTNLSSNVICSGVDIFNFTKLPYLYENQYFYTYILGLYQKMFLRKINSRLKEFERVTYLRNMFINFTKQIWGKDITNEDIGNSYFNTLKNTLELDELYNEIKIKYDILYKDLEIEKNNIYGSIIIILLIFSLMFNTINILFLMYLLI